MNCATCEDASTLRSVAVKSQNRQIVGGHLSGKYVDASRSCKPCKEQGMASGQAASGQGSSLCALHFGIICYLVDLIQGVCRCCAGKGAQGRPPQFDKIYDLTTACV